ncbi:izumo sperm-egg fusion protein 2 [Anolis carolinensis]|uniref:izumo sperm-egg fusion protein 2 n=1 Tax=Anolis carolinensis TaxID=28377 RepID=UPI002F2B1B13
MLDSGLPFVLSLLCLPTAALGCLQCDEQFKENVEKLRTIVVPRQIHDTRIKGRAEVLLEDLEKNFFYNYANNQFPGLAVKRKVDDLIVEVRATTAELLKTTLTDEDLLEKLVAFRKATTLKLKRALKEHQVKACNKKICGTLNYQVMNCKGCHATAAYCMTIGQCFVDFEERLSLRYGQPLKDPNIARTGVAIVLCMGAVLFLVMLFSIIVYWRNWLFQYI